MISRSGVAVFAVLAWGCAMAGIGRSEDVTPPYVSSASVDLLCRPERHLFTKVVLEAEGRRVVGWVVVDTGASFALGLNREALNTLRSPTVTMSFAGSSFAAAGVPLSDFDDQRLVKVAEKTGKDLGDQKLLGLIGFPFLRDYLVTFDLAGKKMHVRPLAGHQRTWRSERPLAEVEYLDQANELFCPVTINGSAKGYLQVDSGLPFGTLLDSGLAKSLTRVDIGGVDMVKVILAEEVTPLPFANRANPFGVEHLYGLMGLNVFRHYLVTIDPARKKLYFEKTSAGFVPTAGAAWVGIRFGEQEERPQRIVVARVTPGGPAELGGLKAEDVVERIDGHVVKTVEEASKAVKARQPGDPLRFDVMRDDKSLQLTITVGALKP